MLSIKILKLLSALVVLQVTCRKSWSQAAEYAVAGERET